MLPPNWVWWGLGWLFLPRMTIGLFILKFTQYETLGIVLMIIGIIFDAVSFGNDD